jgi:molybdenum cofactor biosynthesis protein B
MARGTPAKKHRVEGPKSITAAIITVSDTRTAETDESGRAIKDALVKKGRRIIRYAVCLDDPSNINAEFDASLATDCDIIIFSGGTGIAPRDITVETVGLRLEKRIDGFGELFRQLSYEEIGGAAMLSRAVAGTCQGKIVFCVPGSPDAVRLAMQKLILPELGHMVGLVKGH